MENKLFFGDNLDILRRYIDDDSVDLVHLDSPFKSNQNYKVISGEQNGSRSVVQTHAFEDTWRWDEAATLSFHEVVETGPQRVSQAVQVLRLFRDENDVMAYDAGVPHICRHGPGRKYPRDLVQRTEGCSHS